MNLSEIRTRCRLSIPALKGNKVDTSDINLVINEGQDDICSQLNLFEETVYFDLVADQSIYPIEDIASDFINFSESGLWLLNGSTYRQCWAFTERALDIQKPAWRDQDSGDARYYYFDGTNIGLNPAPDSNVTNGGLLNYFAFADALSSDDEVPFNDIRRYSILEDSIIDYAKWKFSPVVGDKALENPYEIVYLRNLERRAKTLGKRPDILNNQNKYFKNTSLRGRRICRKYY